MLDLNGGVKPGRRIPIWSHLTRTGAPFSLDSKNRFFFLREKEMGFECVSPVLARNRKIIVSGRGLARRVVAPRAKAVHPKTFPPQGGRWMAKGQTDEGALDRTKGKSVLPAHPHPPQCAHWGTFPLAGGRFYGRAIRGPGKRAPQEKGRVNSEE